MTIHNQDITDTDGLDLEGLVKEYGAPHWPTSRNPVGTLNERFWANFFATFNEVIFENREDDFYKYGGKIYDLVSQHLLRSQLANDIQRAAREWSGYFPLSQLCNARHLSGVLTHLKGIVQKEGVFSCHRDYIHVANGVIELNGASPRLVGFDPKYYSRNIIPIEYNPRAKCPKFEGELLKPLPKEDKLVLQKLFGMFSSGINFLQKILILQGAPQSGKSQLAAVARLLFGPANCEELRTAHLGDRFELSRYMAKTLLIGADVAGDFLNRPGASHLKKMTGGDLIGLERKYSNHAASILGVFCILITCNSRLTVKLDGDRGAWLRRLIIINYAQKLHSIDIPGFAQRLVREEGPGILNWALKGLELVQRDVEKIGTLKQSSKQIKRVERPAAKTERYDDKPRL
jgi:putative DNA primase/helicase